MEDGEGVREATEGETPAPRPRRNHRPEAGRYTLSEGLLALLRLFGFLTLSMGGLIAVEWVMGLAFRAHTALEGGHEVPAQKRVLDICVDLAFVVYIAVGTLVHVGEFITYGWLELRNLWRRGRGPLESNQERE